MGHRQPSVLQTTARTTSPIPKWLDAVIKAYAAALAKPVPAKLSAKVDHTRIVPVIKDRAWLAELPEHASRGRTRRSNPLFDELNSEFSRCLCRRY